MSLVYLLRNAGLRGRTGSNFAVTYPKLWSRPFASKTPSPFPPPSPECTLVVSKLDFKLDEKHLEEAFSVIGGIKKVVLKRDSRTRHKKSKGFGYIEFESEQLAKRAKAEMQGLVLNNMPIKLQLKSEMVTKNEYLEDKQYEILYIRNLPYETTEQELMSIFGPYKALKCGLARAPITSMSLGYGFIRFSNKKAAYDALKAHQDMKLKDRKVKLVYAEPKSHNYRFIV